MNPLKRIIGKFSHLFYIYTANCFAPRGKVFMLHWVGDEILDAEHEPYRISTNQFHKLIQWLKLHNIIRLENWENEKNFYALTIDDVPENFYQNAFPSLKEAGLPFTLFVNVSLLDKEGFITKEQLLEMSRYELCTIGSHGVSHEEYTLFNSEEALKDLEVSKMELERLIGKSVEMYAYPYGSFYACGYRHKNLAKGVYKYSFGTVACPITKPLLLKKYFLPRINVDVEFVNSI